MPDEWMIKIEEYCSKYNIPLFYLADTLYEPKVLPMIRGKAFEYTVMTKLNELLPNNEWRISKATSGEELSFHDTDIRVLHKRTGRVIRVECKLAKKQGYRLFQDGHSEIRVKCMRSRTLGTAKVRELAPRLGVPENVLNVHNDQYLPADFDVVITSIGNAFYRTDRTTGLDEWKPNDKENIFLEKLFQSSATNLKDLAYFSIYVARTKDLSARPDTGVICSRKKCQNKTGCGFIPNNPVMYFDAITNKPTNGWVHINESSDLLKSIVLT